MLSHYVVLKLELQSVHVWVCECASDLQYRSSVARSCVRNRAATSDSWCLCIFSNFLRLLRCCCYVEEMSSLFSLTSQTKKMLFLNNLKIERSKSWKIKVLKINNWKISKKKIVNVRNVEIFKLGFYQISIIKTGLTAHYAQKAPTWRAITFKQDQAKGPLR
jgi:hypothetical protein